MDLPRNPYLYVMRFISADKIFDGRRFLPAGAVLALDTDGRLHDILSPGDVDSAKTEHMEGIISPGFVNSHCHLELSHLKGVILRGTGLPEFGKQVIISRDKFSIEEQFECQAAADLEMWQNGMVAVGDISNNAATFAQKTHSNIFYHTFIELIGLDPGRADGVFEKGLEVEKELKKSGLSGSLAPHAPYSTSTQLIRKIAAHDAASHSTLSIHNQESEEETKFFMGQKSGFEELYRFLGLDISWFKPPGHSSLRQIAPEISGTRSLLVHNTVTTAVDLLVPAPETTHWCFCPAANQYIEGRLPDFKLFGGLQGRICIGTDSLASNDSLDLLKEVNIIRSATSVFSVEDLLSAITANGAEALGISGNFGSLMPGKNAGLNLIREKNATFQFIKKIT